MGVNQESQGFAHDHAHYTQHARSRRALRPTKHFRCRVYSCNSPVSRRILQLKERIIQNEYQYFRLAQQIPSHHARIYSISKMLSVAEIFALPLFLDIPFRPAAGSSSSMSYGASSLATPALLFVVLICASLGK